MENNTPQHPVRECWEWVVINGESDLPAHDGNYTVEVHKDEPITTTFTREDKECVRFWLGGVWGYLRPITLPAPLTMQQAREIACDFLEWVNDNFIKTGAYSKHYSCYKDIPGVEKGTFYSIPELYGLFADKK